MPHFSSLTSAIRVGALIAVSLAILSADRATRAEEWTRFRGPNGGGVSSATTVPVKWTEEDYNWRIELPGAGHASPVIWGERIFMLSGIQETGARIVSCHHVNDGRMLWSQKFASVSHRKHRLNSFASSTPTVDERFVYVCWATPEEFIVQAITHAGEPVWRRDFGSFKGSHGFGVSPIVHEGRLIIAGEQEGDSFLASLDCQTGETIWKIDRQTKVTYSTPCIYQPPGRKAELIFTNWRHGITAINPADGSTNWELSVFDQGHTETAIGSPIIAGDLVLGTCGWLGYATHTVAVQPDSDSPGTATELYRHDRGAPLTTTPLVTGGLLFLWSDNGIVTCADVKTGAVHWRNRVGGNYYGSPVAVGEAVYCLSTQGEAVVIAASEEFQLLAKNDIGELSHSTPAVADGVMYLRTFSHLISIGSSSRLDP